MELKDVVDMFVASKQGELVKDATIDSYKKHLKLFIKSLPPDKARLGKVMASDISFFLASERKRGMSPVICSYSLSRF